MFKRLALVLLLSFFAPVLRAEPLLLGAHILLNGLASKYLPDHRPTTYHGPYLGMNYGWKYELSSPYKINSNTEGTNKGSLGAVAGYQFLNTELWDFSLEIFRQLVDYRETGRGDGEDTIDGGGLRIHYAMLVFKLGYAVHGFKGSENYYDGGYYTGFGLEYVLSKVGLYFELTDYYVGDRDKHIAGFDLGLKYYFDNSAAP